MVHLGCTKSNFAKQVRTIAILHSFLCQQFYQFLLKLKEQIRVLPASTLKKKNKAQYNTFVNNQQSFLGLFCIDDLSEDFISRIMIYCTSKTTLP